MRPRSFWISSLSATLLLASCSSRSPEPQVNNNSKEGIISSTPPFKTREPERYRALRTITFTNAAGESKTTTTDIARNQSLRREEETGSGQPVVLLESEQGRFLLLPQAKIYADVSGAPQENSDSELDTSPERLLHSGTLISTYEKLGSEVIAGRQTTKYKVSVNTSSDANVSSTETVIWLDDKIGMPVRSETKGADGSKTVIELSKLELNADSNIFQIPSDFEKVTPAELRRRLKS